MSIDALQPPSDLEAGQSTYPPLLASSYTGMLLKSRHLVKYFLRIFKNRQFGDFFAYFLLSAALAVRLPGDRREQPRANRPKHVPATHS